MKANEKRKSKKPRSEKKSALSDKQLSDIFEHEDTGAAIEAARSWKLIKSPAQPISIRISSDLISKLRSAAHEREIGYQTMAKLIIAENINHYLRKPKDPGKERH